MAVRGQGEAGVVDRQGAGHPVAVHPLVAPRWAAPAVVARCPAIAVPMAAVRPMQNQAVTEPVIATDRARGMVAGTGRDRAIDPVTGSLIALQIAPLNGSEIALVIAPESALGIAPAPSTGIRMTVQGPHVFAIGTIDTAIAVAPGMNGVNRPSAPDPASTRLVLSGRMQPRRLQRPPRQRTI